MKKLILEIELEYDDDAMHGKDEDGIAWFWNEILLYPPKDGGLLLHSQEIGDWVGDVKVLKVREP